MNYDRDKRRDFLQSEVTSILSWPMFSEVVRLGLCRYLVRSNIPVAAGIFTATLVMNTTRYLKPSSEIPMSFASLPIDALCTIAMFVTANFWVPFTMNAVSREVHVALTLHWRLNAFERRTQKEATKAN